MKGIFFSLVTIIIFLGLFSYVTMLTNSTQLLEKQVVEEISAQRIYYYWSDINDNFYRIIDLGVEKRNETLEVWDQLPSQGNINELLDGYGEFIEDYLEDETIEIRFEDDGGNEVLMTNIGNDLVVFPFYLNYSWPNKGKDKLYIYVDEGNFSFLEYIEIYLELKNVVFNCNVTGGQGPDRCNKWAPDNSVGSCTGIDYCLNMTLTVEDSVGTVFTYPEQYFDVSIRGVTNLPVKNVTADYFIKIEVGPLPDLLEIDLHNVLVESDIKLIFNTTEFYTNYLTKLNVSTAFGRRVDYI